MFELVKLQSIVKKQCFIGKNVTKKVVNTATMTVFIFLLRINFSSNFRKMGTLADNIYANLFVMNKLITVLIVFISLSNGYSQSFNSLLNELKKQPKQDSVKAYLCIEIAWEYLENNVDSALIYANQALKYAKTTNNVIQLVDAYNVSGNIYRYQSEFDLVINSFNTGLRELDKTEGQYKKYCSVYINLGNVYNSQKKTML